MTFIEEMQSRLDHYRKTKDFDGLFDYSLYLAQFIINSNKMGRCRDAILKDMLDKDKCEYISRKVVNNMMIPDEFTEIEKAFYKHFADGE